MSDRQEPTIESAVPPRQDPPTDSSLFRDGSIDVHDATQHNLQHVSLRIPKKRITVFVGPSGAGKSSLVFDTIAASSRRELNETFPSFTQQYLPKFGQPHVGAIEHLPVAIVVQQRPIGTNARSTLATYTGVHSLLRLLFARVGRPFVGYSDHFSFNLPQGMCPHCQGLGTVNEIDEDAVVDRDKSLNEGALTFVSFRPGTWRWRRYANTGFFDNDKPLKDYTPEEWELLMHAPSQKIKNPPPQWYKTAAYEGYITRILRSIVNSAEAERHKEAVAAIVRHGPCPACHGTRLNEAALSCRINGSNIAEVSALDLHHVLEFLRGVNDPLAAQVVRELTVKIGSLVDIGLGYLSLDRPTDTLSGGEAQRIKIAKFLTSSLTDLLYVLDEPTVGLHPHDVQLIVRTVQRLRDKGNTVLIVEHHPQVIAAADHLVEVGPEAGRGGGRITFEGDYGELTASDTVTGRWLRRAHASFADPREPTGWLRLRDLADHNLRHVDVDVPLGVLTVLSGVAGSGKSTLMHAIRDTLPGVLPGTPVDLSQAGIGVNIRSTPATYLNVLDDIRALFAAATGAPAGLFSYNGRGACPMCKGKGVTITNMAFMDPVVQVCEQCHGRRYNDEALQHQYRDHDIAEVLAMSVDQAGEFFAASPESRAEAVHARLADLARVGLGYLSLDQPLTTLSGGELQRLKLALQLGRTGTAYLFDEPTAGLHARDTARIIDLFQELVDRGNTLVVIEHNMDVVRAADWLIDMGPDAGTYGGRVMFSGMPRDAMAAPASKTGQALRALSPRATGR